MLRAAVGHDAVAIGPEDAIGGQADRFAHDVPEAVVDGGGVGELALAAEVGFPLGGEFGEVEDGFAGKGALGILEPAEVAPVGVEVALVEGVIALDAAGGDDGCDLVGGGARGCGGGARGRARCGGCGRAVGRMVDDVDLDLLDGEVGQIGGFDANGLRRSLGGVGEGTGGSAGEGEGRGVEEAAARKGRCWHGSLLRRLANRRERKRGEGISLKNGLSNGGWTRKRGLWADGEGELRGVGEAGGGSGCGDGDGVGAGHGRGQRIDERAASSQS